MLNRFAQARRQIVLAQWMDEIYLQTLLKHGAEIRRQAEMGSNLFF